MKFFDRFRAPPNEKKYAELYMSALKSLGDTRAWKYEENRNRLVCGDAGVVNLHNMYREFIAVSKPERADALARQARAMMQHYIPSDLAEARPRLRPVIRSATERAVTFLQLEDSPTRQEIAFRPLCDNIEIGIAYDNEFSIARLSESKLREWNVTFDEVYDIAIDNLRIESSKPFLRLKNGVLASQYGDHYDASRLLIPDLLYRQGISGEPVVMAPNRTTLLLTGDTNTAGFETMLQISEEALAQPRPLPPLMLRWDGRRWQRFIPDGLASKLHELRVRDLAADYQDQLAYLNERHQKKGIDIFSAQFMMLKKPSGNLTSACAWTKGVHSLIPETDIVALVQLEPAQSALVPWSELVRECGHLMRRTEHVPVRYEVSGFPDDAVFQSFCERYPRKEHADS
ncbi:hypothetical protein [Paraburkholderia humisilvae]|uniref:DUF1444 family protein n=1 Tax=Paraburkholderia humisilvae TaxID=627669 RepID=A0A6J5E7L5_9BURK|nr:hypothetical protein [Paraburkholderia humisilvae]CAB3761326.1 hypothetical protein LMG29542_04048 [Paraburkholderia humisilvae]